MKTLLLLLSCIFSASAIAHTSFGTVKPKMHFTLKETTAVTGTLKVVPGKIWGFKGKHSVEYAKLLESFAVIEKVINSEEFKLRVINFAGGYTSSNGLSNKQVYEFLMKGKELIGGNNTLGEMNFDVKRYNNPFSKVIGRTNPGYTNVMEINGKFYQSLSVAEMASNVTHEWIHLCGFYHDGAWEHTSVPYAVGYIMEELAKKYLDQGYLD